MLPNKKYNILDIIKALREVISACADVITIADYYTIHIHEKRVQIGLDNITEAISVLNRNFVRSGVNPFSGSSPENLPLIRSNIDDESMIILDGQTLPEVSNFEEINENIKKISQALCAVMSKTVKTPNDLIFESTETLTKNADNLQTLTFNATVDNMNLDLTDLINQFKLVIGDKEYKFSEVIYNLLKVSQDSNFKPDNLPEALLALSANHEITARLIGL